MKKGLLVFVICLFVGICWYTALESYIGLGAKYQEAVNSAQKYEKKDIYIRAIDSYNDAMQFKKEDYTAMYAIAQNYKKLDEMDNYASEMEKILYAHNAQESVLNEIYKYYMDSGMLSKAFDLAVSLHEKFPDNDTVKKIYNERKGDYEEILNTYDNVSVYRDKYAIYEMNGKKGIVDSQGEIVIDAVYDSISFPDDNQEIAVVDGSDAYYIDLRGYKYRQPDVKYEYLSGLFEGAILAKQKGLYGYLGEGFVEKSKFEWSDATIIYNNCGAVKKDEKWALINNKFELLTDYEFEEIKVDDFRRCSVAGVVWCKKNGKWFLYNTEGTKISEQGYDDVKMFVAKEPCAVMIGDKWGFIGMDGAQLIKPMYTDANSFNKGFAPVAMGSSWGLIDTSNNVCLEYQFDELKSLNDAGVAVCNVGGVYSMIQLKIFKTEADTEL